MLQIFLISALIILLFSPFGTFFSNNEKKISNFSSQLIYSSIVISFIALILNFFISLNLFVNSSLILVSCYLFFKNRDLYFNKKYFVFLLLSSLIVFLLVTKSHTYRPDSGLYHFPYISILVMFTTAGGFSQEIYLIGSMSAYFQYIQFSCNTRRYLYY